MPTRTRMVYVAALLLTVGWEQPAIISAAQQDDGRCEKITIPLCTGMKYNMTRMPNLVGISNQKDAALQVHEFIPLVQSGCSRLLKFFLCSLYAPMCTEQVDETLVIPACRTMCLQVKSKCEPVLERFNFEWPAVLDCSRLPDGDADRSQLCIDPPAVIDELDDAFGSHGPSPANNFQLRQLLDALRSPNSSSWRHDVIGTSPASRVSTVMTSRGSVCSQRYVMTDDGSGSRSRNTCRPRCDVDVLYAADDKRFMETWMVCWSLISLVVTAFTCATFLVDTDRFRYPERPAIILAGCSLIYSAAYIIRLAAGAHVISCVQSPDNLTSYLVSGDLHSTWCVVTVVLLYFFGMAASLWWVALTAAFYLAAGRKWSREAISEVSGYFHVVAWALPAVKTATVLALRRFTGNELTGLCDVGSSVSETTTLIWFVLVPLVTYLLVGISLVAAGFVAMFRIRHDLIEASALVGMRQLEKLMVKIGAFAVLYTVPATCVVACWFYEALYARRWRQASLLMPCVPVLAAELEWDCRLPASMAPMAVGALRVLASLAAGATSFVWVCSRKTLRSWRRFCSAAPRARKLPIARDPLTSRDLSARRAASRDFRLAMYRHRDDVTRGLT